MKKKIALFYDESTESGKLILDFLTPIDKRKSDIVGRIILNWIEEHGATVPVEWLSRDGEISGKISLYAGPKPGRAIGRETVEQEMIREQEKPVEDSGAVHDADLIRAGLASFMGS